jgi:hypothetical protein
MALMIPNNYPPETAPGERLVFESLRTDPQADDWIVLHSLHIADHVSQAMGEADFVVIIPGQGCVLIEVKSHKSIRRDCDGWWMGSDPVDKRGPFKQAHDAMWSVMNYLAAQRVDYSEIPFSYAACMTAATFETKSPEWHTWQLINPRVIASRGIAGSILNVIVQARVLIGEKKLPVPRINVGAPSLAVCQGLAQLLRPRFSYQPPPAQSVRNWDNELERCTQQQNGLLDALSSNKRVIIRGLAGTGKTTMATHALRRALMGDPVPRVAFFCYNRFLGDALKKECKDLDGAANCEIGSFHQYLLKLARVTGARADYEDPIFWRETLPQLVLEKLVAIQGNTAGFDLLIVDEAQDLLWPPYLDVIELLLKGGLKQGRWMIFGDFKYQNCFNEYRYWQPQSQIVDRARGAADDLLEWFDRSVIGCDSMKFELSVNCRNTPEVSELMSSIAAFQPGYISVLRGLCHEEPDVKYFGSGAEQEVQLAAAIKLMLGRGFKPDDIVVLSPLKNGACVQGILLLPEWQSRIAEYPKPNVVRFSTIHAFKGLEAKAVILTDISCKSYNGEANLLYVGMSRALHCLTVLVAESFRPEFQAALPTYATSQK